MGRVVATLEVMGDKGFRAYQLLGLWRPKTVEEAVRKVDELWNLYSKQYDCVRLSPLIFKCDVKEKGVLQVAWIPESNEDLEQLILYTAKKIREEG